MTEEELQSLDSTDQESTIHEPVAIGVEQEHTVGVNTSDPTVFDVGQTHASTNAAAHVIKNEGVDLTVNHVGGNSIEFGLCYGGHMNLDFAIGATSCSLVAVTKPGTRCFFSW